MGRAGLRFRGSKRRLRLIQRRHGGGISVWLFLLGLLLLETLALVQWLLSAAVVESP